jgi:transcriptional regulator with XRE-family HTH domain
MPVAITTKLNALSEALGSPGRLADLLGVSPGQVTRWLRGEAVDVVDAERIDLLEFVLSGLARLYSPEALALWLEGWNPRLGLSRPADLIQAGRTLEVAMAIADERAGGYA